MTTYIDPNATMKDFTGKLINYYEYPDVPGYEEFVPKHFIKVDKRPSHHHEWIDGAWVENTESSLTEKKQFTFSDVDAAHREAEKEPVTFKDVPYDSGMKSVQNLTTLLAASQVSKDTSVIVYDANNQPQTLSIADLKALITAVHQATQELVAKKQSLKTAIDSATSHDELEKIKW